MNSNQFTRKLKYLYTLSLFDIVACSLVSASQVDPKIQQEVSQLPVGLCFAMTIFSSDIKLCLKVNESYQFELASCGHYDVNIQFKHIQHAFSVLSFQESTAIAFAHDRMIVDGDLMYAMYFVRCLNQLEAIILPKMIAHLAVKQYPKDLKIRTKIKLARSIYTQVAYQYIKRI